jgi:acyl-CoA hydrolase
MPQAKVVADSETTLVQLMEITHANIAGIVHGGEVMKLVDTAAGIAAIKHAGGMCVTVSMDEMSFLHPVHVGDLVIVKVGVRVEVEDVMTGETKHTSSAYLVFVALDEEGRPRAVPPLVAETSLQHRRRREAKIRRKTRLEHRQAIELHRREEERGAGAEGEPGDESRPPQRHLRI